MAKKVTAEIVQQSLDKLTIYLSPYLSLANTAMINYIVDDSWTHEIPKSIQSEICSEESALEAINLFWRIHDRSKTTVATDNFNSYSKYLKESEAHSLDALSDLWITPEALKQQLASVSNESGLHVKGYMSEKKAHEVEIASDVIYTICSTFTREGREPVVVDAGDGKGYLSSRLALKYKLKVLGVDARPNHTSSAISRLEKLEKLWDNVEREDQQAQAGVVVTKTGKRKRRKVVQNPERMPSSNQLNKMKDQNYRAVTHFITHETDFLQLLHDSSVISGASKPAICLSGLHTCGNLAPSCLRMFQKCAQIEAVCNIGCCYNNLDEQFTHPADAKLPQKRYRVYEGKTIPIDPTPTATDNAERTYGFPMSQYLIGCGYALGRNARMLAVQPIQRVIDTPGSPHQHLFYRALLEVLIVNEYPNLKNAVHVGRIKKCTSFLEYVRKCSKRMDLLNFDHFSDEKIIALYESHRSQIEFLNAFYLMRLSLAPIVEAIILLDRLLYLKELAVDDAQETSIRLIKFFDSILSPRCYGIVGLK